MKKTLYTSTFLIVFLLTAKLCAAQSVPVGSPADDYIRFLQLAGDTIIDAGFLNRPIVLNEQTESNDSGVYRLIRSSLLFKKNTKFYFGVLPIAFNQQLVTHHPLFQNDGSLMPARGYQVQLTGGVYGKIGPLQFQLSPEVVFAANTAYKQTPDFGSKPQGSFQKLYPGQSYVRVEAGPIALSAATESLWWGPGVHHSLLMSNQAPGFKHLKIHSTKPFRTPIGSFEWTLLGGRLASEMNLPHDNDFLQNNTFGSTPSNRYLSAYLFSYSPRFLQGFDIGLARALQQYETDIKTTEGSVFKKYLPVVFKPVQKKNAEDDDTKRIDQVASVFFRWRFKKSQAEIYGEYGFNDYKKNVRDYIINLPHSAAYLAGFRKVIPLRNSKFIDANIEILQMRQTTDRLVRDAGLWYVHGSIWEGYTHQNQVLGAAFASNAQTLQLSHRQGLQRTAITLQRFQRDPDRAAPNWNDWVVGVGRSQFFEGFYFEGQMQFIASQNYAWQAGTHPIHLAAKAGIRYYFHD